MFTVKKPIQRIEWAASAFKPRYLPQGVLRNLVLDVILTTTNGASAALNNHTFAKAMKTLTIKLNGQDDMMIMPGYFLNYLNSFDFSVDCYSEIDTTIGAGKTQKLSVPFPFALNRAGRAKDAVLDGRKSNNITSIELGIDWDAAAIGTDMTVTSGYLELLGVLYDQAPADLQTFRHEFSYITDVLGATGEVDIKLPFGGQNEYRRLYIFTFDNTGALSDSQASQFQLQAGTYSWRKMTPFQIKSDNNYSFSRTPETGVYIIDLTTDGNMSERLNARNLDELILKVTSLVTNGTIEIVAEKVIGR